MSDVSQNFGSFRDPAGYVFEHGEQIFRTVNAAGREDYEFFVQCGLAESLQRSKWLIPFTELSEPPMGVSMDGVWKYLSVDRVPFLSYPYEWCFHQLKDAAILTLKIQLAAMEREMTLKDASAYNVQMYQGRPIFIDILSFERYEEGTPWTAYRQFVMHFLAPLLLMSKKDLRFSALFRDWVDGIPIDFASKNLPKSTRWSPSCWLHIHYHAKLLHKYESTRGDAPSKKNVGKMPKKALIQLVDGLLRYVQDIQPPKAVTEWGDYYNDTNYTDSAFRRKGEIVRAICERIQPKKVCDLGANCGEFSRVLPKNIPVIVSADIDPVAVDKNYVQVRRAKEANIYPVLQDLCNPSPGIGWMNQERASFAERSRCDLVLCLALIHHLCIGNNLPFEYVARFFRNLSSHAVVEFVPKEDSQVQRLLSSREDIFPDYTLEKCVEAFSRHFSHVERIPVEDSLRTMLVFED